MDSEKAFHLLHGWPFIKLPGNRALQDEPERWAALWSQYGRLVLPEFVTKNPGERPRPWWLFDAVKLTPKQKRGESAIEWLSRLRLLKPVELEGIRRRAEELASYNQWRSRDHSTWIEPGPIEEFAVERGLVDAATAARIAGRQAAASAAVEPVNGQRASAGPPPGRDYERDGRRSVPADVRHNGWSVPDPGGF
jgi:hypothetical protein